MLKGDVSFQQKTSVSNDISSVSVGACRGFSQSFNI